MLNFYCHFTSLSSYVIFIQKFILQKNSHLYIKHEDPDVFCLQETKCDEESIPKEMKIDGYHVYWSSAEKKGYAGTGLFSKVKPLEVTYGLGERFSYF